MTLCLAIYICIAALGLQAQEQGNYKRLLWNSNVKIESSNLPLVFINVKGKTIQREGRILAQLKVINNGAGKLNHGDTLAYPNQNVDYEGFVALKYRGNSSFNASDKKPFSFRPLTAPDVKAKKAKVKILGMGKDNDWALLAPYSDKSMMRDVLTFELARPYFDYVPSARYCELILDGTYYGIYIMTERPTKGSKRLNLDDPGEKYEDLTGDYLVEIDRNDDSNYPSPHHPITHYGGTELKDRTIKYQYKHPKEDEFRDLPVGTKTELIRQINLMENSFLTSSYRDPLTGYRKYIDVTSFIDYMLATEFALNIDGYRLSTKLYKYSEAKAKAKKQDHRWKMSLWDFNIAYGNANYFSGESTDLWQYDFNSRNSNDGELVPFYWSYLLQDPRYVSEMKARWAEYRQGSYDTERVMNKIDSIANLLSSGGAIDRNQQAYEIMGRHVWPNAYVGSSYQDEINYLKSWIKRRIRFMDKQLGVTTTQPIATEAVEVKSGFNADLIAEAQPSNQYTTAGLDRERSNFYTKGVKKLGAIPEDGAIISENEKIHYQLAAYDENNGLSLSYNGSAGTIHFAKPFKTPILYFLLSSGNGVTMLEATVRYKDGTHSDVQVCMAPDWAHRDLTGTEALSRLGRIRTDGYITHSPHYSISENYLEVDENKEVESVTFKQRRDAVASIFAFSRQLTSAETAIDHTYLRNKNGAAGNQLIGIYNASGLKLSTLQHGLNILKYSDGSTRKVMRK